MSTRKKIALIGAGNIGGELAALACAKQLGDVVLYDIAPKENFAKGKALDLEQNSAIRGFDASVSGTSKWSDCEGSDVLIVTAGIPAYLQKIQDAAAEAARAVQSAYFLH